jgi:hypothetical protein
VKQIATALVKAQKEFGRALKSSTNPHFRSRYADLATVVESVIDALNNNGIYLMQLTHETPDGAMAETTFIHESGEMLSAGKLFFPASKHDAQGYASALTYVRRYSLMAACAIAPEDDDGSAASKPREVPKPTKSEAPKPEEPKAQAPKEEVSPEAAKDRVKFILDMFKAFLPDARDEASLKTFWSQNRDSINIVKDFDQGAYVQLLADFKARKDEIIKSHEDKEEA